MEESENGDFPLKPDETTETVTKTSDFQPKKLARQLDFTEFCFPSTITPMHLQLPPKPKPKSKPKSYPTPRAPLSAAKSEARRPQPQAKIEVKDGTPKDHKQCHCKQSKCLKLYCACFASGTYCDGCDCNNCHNNVENEVTRGEAVDITLERNPNAFRPKITSSPHGTRDNRVNHRRASGPPSDLSVVPVGHIVKSPVSGSSAFTYSYRSLLADTIRLQDTRQLCSLLVVVSEATKILADKNGTAMQGARENPTASFLSAQDRENCEGGVDVQKAVSDDHLSENQADIIGTDDSRCGGGDSQIGRPMSPGTLALMCDEKDTLFMAVASPNRVLNHSCKADVYVEQERLVLASFRDYLNRLIHRGNIKETKCFSSARAETEGKNESVGNCIVKVNTEMLSEQETVGNGTIKAHGPDNAEMSPTFSAATATFIHDAG